MDEINGRAVIDIDLHNLQNRVNQLFQALDLIEKRFMAIAFDYNHYIDNSWGQKEIFELRDNVNYRFFSARLQLELLVRQHYIIQERLEKIAQKDPKSILGEVYPINPHFEYAEKEVSSIFDSFLYHLVSVFDYLATLTNYVCGDKKNRQDTLKWTALARGARDATNHFGTKPLSAIIKRVDNNFVSKLYDYRSHLIHKKGDLSRHSFNVNIGKYEMKIVTRFITNDTLIKHFSDLKEMSKSNYLTIRFTSFWLIDKTIATITDVLFALKKEIESNPRVPCGMFVLHDPKTNTVKSVSTAYWHEEEYNKTNIPPPDK